MRDLESVILYQIIVFLTPSPKNPTKNRGDDPRFFRALFPVGKCVRGLLFKVSPLTNVGRDVRGLLFEVSPLTCAYAHDALF